MILRHLSLTGVFCATLLLCACGAQYDWSHASSLNTVAAYRHFLSRYPSDPHAVDAQHRIAMLQDEQAWTAAQIDSSVQGYQRYLTAEPNGTHVQVAREEIATRERDAAWQTAQTDDNAQSFQDFLNKYPFSPEAAQARDKLRAMTGYRAEFGTARSQRVADKERDALRRRFTKELSRIDVLAPDAKDRDYRITSAPMSAKEAGATCETLKHAGRSCTVVQLAG